MTYNKHRQFPGRARETEPGSTVPCIWIQLKREIVKQYTAFSIRGTGCDFAGGLQFAARLCCFPMDLCRDYGKVLAPLEIFWKYVILYKLKLR